MRYTYIDYAQCLVNFNKLQSWRDNEKDSGCISLLPFRLPKLPSQCYSDGPGNLGNPGRNKLMQPQHAVFSIRHRPG